MIRRTELGSNLVRGVAEFYDSLARDYDAMTGCEARFTREKPLFRSLVERFGIRTAVDAGCGSGLHALLLAQLGVKVTAVDISAGMVRRLRRHARELGTHVTALRCRFQEMGKSVPGGHDALFCLGNSLAHVLRTDGLRSTFRSFAGALRPGGVMVLQLLNYERILRRRDLIQSVKESEGKAFVRFYSYDEEGIIFNILALEASGRHVRQTLRAVRLRPWVRSEIKAALARAGFVKPRFFGSMSMEKFVPGASTDLVVLARRV